MRLTRIRDRSLRWRTGFAFAAVGVPAAYLGSVLNHRVGEPVVLVTFAVVTVVAAAAMLVESRTTRDAEECAGAPDPRRPTRHPVPDGTGTASPSGLPSSDAGCSSGSASSSAAVPRSASSPGSSVSAGASWSCRSWSSPCGCRCPPPIGTSLLIMVFNSSAALASRIGDLAVDWAVVVPFTLASVVGTLLGRRVADRLSGAALTRIFALLLLLVGIFVGVESLLGG